MSDFERDGSTVWSTAMLLDLRSVLISSRFDAGVEKSMDLFAQFEFATVEAPSALSVLSDVERASPRGEFWRGSKRFSMSPFTLSVLRTVERVSPRGEF